MPCCRSSFDKAAFVTSTAQRRKISDRAARKAGGVALRLPAADAPRPAARLAGRALRLTHP
jgi:hypothetical protein